MKKNQDGKILKLQKETQDLRDIEQDLNNKITENDKEMEKCKSLKNYKKNNPKIELKIDELKEKNTLLEGEKEKKNRR